MSNDNVTDLDKIDLRSKRGKELADRINKQTVLDRMPKLYYVSDLSMGRYRVGRTDWPGDVFELISAPEFESFLCIYQKLNMPIHDLSDDDDDSEWEKIRNG